MRSTRTSFKLQRLTRPSSVRKESSTTSYSNADTFKLAAINSVNRGIKQNTSNDRFNTVQPLAGNDLKKLRKQPKAGDNSFFQAIHESFTDIRSNYDEIKRQRVQKQHKIKKLKAEINKYRIYQSQLQEKINEGKNVVLYLSEAKSNKKQLLQQSQINKKILENMKKKYKFDKVIYDQRKFDLQKQLKYLRTQLNIFKKDGFSIEQQSERAQKVYSKYMKQLQEQAIQRKQHLNNLEQMIQEKYTLATNNKIRSQQINDIAQRAMLDKGMDQKHWRKIYLTNLFIQKMLRNKIEKQMEKFQQVQNAFKKIRASTGVSDSKTLINKYLNKQTTYGQLLGKIAENEKTIQKLQQERQQMNKQTKQLEIQKQTLQAMKNQAVEIRSQLKELENYQIKKNRTIQFKSLMKSWLTKQYKKFKNILNQSMNQKIENNQESLKNGMKLYLETIVKIVEENSIQNQFSINPQDVSLTNTKSLEKITIFQPKVSRKKSQNQSFDEQQFLPQSVQNQQKEIMNMQRQKLFKENEKFMKDLRKKKFEQRKIRMEKQSQLQKKQKARIAQLSKKMTNLEQ